jgi:carbamate kinase
VSTKTEAHRFAAERGRTVAADGRWWRWVVASLEPLDMLVDAGVLVVCAGGGIPTVAGAIIARSF